MISRVNIENIKRLTKKFFKLGISFLVSLSLIWNFPLLAHGKLNSDSYNVFAKNTSTGERYVYDPKTGKWVLTSAKEETEEEKRERIYSEYLDKARESLDNGNYSLAREYAEKALEINKSGREAQFLMARVEQAEAEMKEKREISTEAPEVTSMDQIAQYLEKAREYSKDASQEKAEPTDQEVIDRRIASLRQEKEEEAAIAQETIKKTQEVLAAPVSGEEETEEVEAARVSGELERARLEAQRALEEKEEEERRLEEEQRKRETERQRTEDLINEYITKADTAAEAGNYDEARSYARRALSIEEDNYQAKMVLARIDMREAQQREEEERLRREEETIQKAEEIASYLEEAQVNLEAKRFDAARNYAQKAAGMDPENPMSRYVLARIDEDEKAYVEEQKRLKDAEEKEAWAREEALRQAAQEDARQKTLEEEKRRQEEAQEKQEKAEKIAAYLKKSEESLNKQNFSRAISYVERAFRVDEDSAQAQEMLARIKKAEEAYNLQQERLREEEEAQRKALEEEERRQEEARKERRKAEKIKSYLEKAAKSLEDDNFSRARKYVKKIEAVDKSDPVIKTALADIDMAEQAYIAEQKRIEEEKEAQKKARLLERERKEKSRKINSYLSKAERSLKYDKFDKARGYVEKALSLDESNVPAREALALIDDAQADYEALEAGIILPVEPVIISEPTEDELIKQAELIAGHLQDAEANLEENNFSAARKNVQKALEIDLGNPQAHDMLAEIEKKEVAYTQDVGDIKFDKKEASIHRSLENARRYLSREKFARARSSAIKAIKEDPDREESKDFLASIDQEEAVYREKQEEEKKRRGAVRASREEARREARRKKEDIKIRKNIKKAKELLAEGNYKAARKHAYQAWKKIPHDTQVAVLLAEINKQEMFGPEGDIPPSEEDTIRDIKLPKEKDPLKMHDEKKSFIEKATDEIFFNSSTFSLGEAEEEPQEVYSIDDCVNIAIQSNQKIKASDEQVKLAHLRVWEARRKFFPEVTAKLERGYGAIGGNRPARPAGTWGAPAGSGAQVMNAATRHYQGHKYAFEIKQTVFDGFGTWYEIQQAQTNKRIIELERQKTINEVTADTKKAYYNLDKTNKAIEAQGRIKKDINYLYGVIEKGYQKEVIAQVDYLKVKGQSMQADFKYLATGEDRNMAEMVLLQAMNMEPDRHIRIEKLERPKNFLSIGLQNCYNLAVTNSPDVKIKQETIKYYEFARKGAKAKGWPKVEFEGSFGEAYENFQPLDQPNDRPPPVGGATAAQPSQDAYRSERNAVPEWYAGLTATLPLWGSSMEYKYVREIWAPTVSSFRGSESATSYLEFRILDDLEYFEKLQQSRASFTNAKYEYMKAKQDVALQVKELYFKYRKSILQMNVSDVQAAHQKMFVAVLEERRKYGEMDIPRLVEEYEKLGEYEYAVIQADADYFISVSDLSKAVGVPNYFDPFKEEDRTSPRLVEDTGSASSLTLGDTKEERERSKIHAYIEDAREALDRKKFAKARKSAKKALKIDSDNGEARELLASIDQAEGIAREQKK